MNPTISYFNSHLPKQNQYGSLQSYHQSMPSLFGNLSVQRKLCHRQTIQDLKNKMNKYNNELLLPRCLQKSFTRKFTLSPLANTQKQIKNRFKLKNYQLKPAIDYDHPVQEDQQQQQQAYQINQYQNQNNNNSLLNTSHFSKFQSTSSKFQNKQNMKYQDQMISMLMTQSKLKYQPKNRLKNNKLSSKKSLDLTNYYDNEGQKLNQTKLTKSNSQLNKTKSQISLRTFFTVRKSVKPDHNNDLLNSTRTKLLSHLNEAPKHQLTKADLFPLERLLQKRNRKINFRNKWFNQKTVNLEQKL